MHRWKISDGAVAAKTNRRHREETYRPEVMPKMNIHISLQSDIPTYEQIKIQIKAQILDGRLAPSGTVKLMFFKENPG